MSGLCACSLCAVRVCGSPVARKCGPWLAAQLFAACVCRDAAAEAARVARSAVDLEAREKQLAARESDLAAARKDLQEREAAVKQAQDMLAAQQVIKPEAVGAGSWCSACWDCVQSCICGGNLRNS